MGRPSLEVADIFRDHGPAWRAANAGHVSLDQLKVMSAIERCRTAVLGGHVARCEDTPFMLSKTHSATALSLMSASASPGSTSNDAARTAMANPCFTFTEII
jgi:hypothetical protein